MKDDRFLRGTRHDLYSKHERNITTAPCTASPLIMFCGKCLTFVEYNGNNQMTDGQDVSKKQGSERRRSNSW